MEAHNGGSRDFFGKCDRDLSHIRMGWYLFPVLFWQPCAAPEAAKPRFLLSSPPVPGSAGGGWEARNPHFPRKTGKKKHSDKISGQDAAKSDTISKQLPFHESEGSAYDIPAI